MIQVEKGVEFRKGVRVAVDGRSFRMGGRHNSSTGMQEDCVKYSWAAVLGWLVVRATNTMITDHVAITILQEAFRARGYGVTIEGGAADGEGASAPRRLVP
jgi:hypothetical protein